jgi:Protein of unknown function (DUF3634)
MMEYAAIPIAVIVFGALAFWQSYIRGRVFVLRIREGSPAMVNGQVPPAFVADVADVAHRHGVRSGTIRGYKRDGRVSLRFSRSIPSGCRQGIRNVWAMHSR